jgi:hypothetical protein
MKASVSVRAVGVVWYGSKEAYVWARANMEDGEMMTRAYGAWKQNAKAVLRNLKADASAGLIERVEIKPLEFKAWCEAHGLGLNAFSRARSRQKWRGRGRIKHMPTVS